MRLTTRRSSVAVAATAGLALLVSGCSSSEPTAAPVVHRSVTAQPAAADDDAKAEAKAKAKKVSPRKQVKKAIRASLEGHSVTFRQRTTAWWVKGRGPEDGATPNPLESIAGTVNFKKNLGVWHYVADGNAAQPNRSLFTVLQKGSRLYGGLTDRVNNGGAWAFDTAPSGESVDALVRVLNNTRGKVQVVDKQDGLRDGERNLKVYSVRVDVGQSILDNGRASDRALGRSLLGQLATEKIWVDSDGRIVQVRTVFDTARVDIPDVNPSIVRAVVVTLRLTNYGVDLHVPPHPTEV